MNAGRFRIQAGSLLGAVVGCSGLLLIAGWITESRAIVLAVPGYVMVLSTACGLVLAGLAGCIGGLTSPRLRALHTVIGFLLATLGAAGLGQGLLGLPLGLDFHATHAWLADRHADATPGRMSAATSTGFLLVGCILLLAPRSAASSFLVRTLILAVAGLGGLVLVGHLLDLPRILESYWLTHFSLAAAAGFVGLALALWLDLARSHPDIPRLVNAPERRIVVAGMLVLATSVGVTGVTVFSLMHSATQNIRTTNLEFTLAARSALIGRSIGQAAAQTAEVARRQGMVRSYADARASPDGQPDPVFLAKLARDLLDVDFMAVAFLDVAGRELSRAGEFVAHSDLNLPLPPVATGVRAALSWDGDLLLDVRADIAKDGVRLGEFVAQHRLPDLRGIGNDVEALGKTTEFGLCGQYAGSLHCMPTRFEPRVFNVPVAERGSRLPMKYATDGKAGVLELTDDRGRQVMAAYAPVAGHGLGLMLKTDISELAAPVVQRMAPFGLLLLLITAAGGWLLKKSVAPLAGRLAKSEEQLRMALDGSKLALWDWDIRSGRVALSEHWNALLGGAAKPLVSSIEDLSELIHPDDAAGVQQRVQQLLSGDTSHYDAEHRVRTFCGDWKWIRSRGHIVRHATDGRPLRALGTNVDIDERKAYELELAHHAAHDLLTGLPNRGLFDDRLDQAIARATRSKGLMAVLYIDIDRFKSVNDRFGHGAGDAVLKESARRLTALVRSIDTVARLGGDEFAVILESLDDRESGLRMAARLVTTMRRKFTVESRHVASSVSVGVAFCCEGNTPGVDAATLLAQADRALYAAKAAGRDRFCIAEQPRTEKRLQVA